MDRSGFPTKQDFAGVSKTPGWGLVNGASIKEPGRFATQAIRRIPGKTAGALNKEKIVFIITVTITTTTTTAATRQETNWGPFFFLRFMFCLAQLGHIKLLIS